VLLGVAGDAEDLVAGVEELLALLLDDVQRLEAG